MTIGRRLLHLAPPFLVHDYEPVARQAHRSGLLKQRVEQSLDELRDCRACPRNCGVDRTKGWMGSGTIFFGLCNLRCVFCQNWDISQKKKGWELDALEIADLMLKLQNETKCHNINFVTPEHVVPQVIEAIYHAVEKGLNLPIVYNTSSYDSMRSLELLDDLVDIYMPDFKFWDPDTSQRLCKARDYPQVTKKVIAEMHRQVGPLCFDERGLAKKGVLLRHLVMPNYVEESKKIMEFVAEDISKDTYVHIMEQYRPEFTEASEGPCHKSAELKRDPMCKVIAVSTDSANTHLAYVKTDQASGGLGPVNIPLVSDKNMAISRAYGVLKESEGVCFRATVIISNTGKIRQITVNDFPVGRSVEETMRLLKAFAFSDKHGEVCPANWRPGRPTFRTVRAEVIDYIFNSNKDKGEGK